MIRQFLRVRRPVILLVHLALIVASNNIAFLLRFDGSIPDQYKQLWWSHIGWLVAIRLAVFAAFRLFEGLWRYTGIWDLRNIILAVGLSTGVFVLVDPWIAPGLQYPRSIPLVDSLVLISLCGGVRLGRRVFVGLSRIERTRRVLILGAGDAGEMLLRDMRRADSDFELVGFLDDNDKKIGNRMHGVPVLGPLKQIAPVIAATGAQDVFIAISNLDPSILRQIVTELAPLKVKISTVPSLRGRRPGRVSLGEVRQLSMEDLLARPPVGLNPRPVRELISAKRVLVSGAGGSIGSELCRQLVEFAPASLTMVDRYENTLHAISLELADKGHRSVIRPVIADVTDSRRVRAVLAETRPDIVFHAAAHKHVPLMEENPGEAVKNNVSGVRVMATASSQLGVDRFVLISTDKAVHPQSVMGATKRLAELLIQRLAANSPTTFLTVRFGNVLGSNGSVVPRFVEQIKAGGPVTITDPEVRRYFMLISEAVELVLQVAAQGQQGGVYVLEMGEQIKLVDLASQLIALSGLRPGEDIQIVYTGLRPGEKLSEQLVGEGERTRNSPVEKVQQVVSRVRVTDQFVIQLKEIEHAAQEGDRPLVMKLLGAMLPEFGAQPVAAGKEGESDVVGAAVDGIDVLAAGLACPSCQRPHLYRSRASHLVERVRKQLTARRPYRCSECGWRGWRDVVEYHVPIFERADTEPPNLLQIDSTLRPTARRGRRQDRVATKHAG